MGPKSTVTGTVADRVRAQHGVSPVSVSPPTARLKNTEEAAALAVAMVLTLFVVTEDDLSATFTAAHLKKQLDACKIAKALGMPEVHTTWLQQGFSKYNNKLSQAYGMIFTQTKSPDKGISDRTWTVRFTAARTRPSQAKCLAEVQKHRTVLMGKAKATTYDCTGTFSWPALVHFVQTAPVSPPSASAASPKTAQPPRPLKPVSELGWRQFARRQADIKEQLAAQGLTIDDVAAVAQGASKKRPAPATPDTSFTNTDTSFTSTDKSSDIDLDRLRTWGAKRLAGLSNCCPKIAAEMQRIRDRRADTYSRAQRDVALRLYDNCFAYFGERIDGVAGWAEVAQQQKELERVARAAIVRQLQDTHEYKSLEEDDLLRWLKNRRRWNDVHKRGPKVSDGFELAVLDKLVIAAMEVRDTTFFMHFFMPHLSYITGR